MIFSKGNRSDEVQVNGYKVLSVINTDMTTHLIVWSKNTTQTNTRYITFNIILFPIAQLHLLLFCLYSKFGGQTK
jgi:hypothetical protein